MEVEKSHIQFRLVDLLAATVVLSILACLLAPFLFDGKTDSGRKYCLNNLKQLGTAMMTYENAKKRYPGYKDAMALTAPLDMGGEVVTRWPVSWLIMVLPNIERRDLHDRWKTVDTTVEGGGHFLKNPGPPLYEDPVKFIDVLVCPSNPVSGGQFPQPLAYVVNTGQADVPSVAGGNSADWQANGVFHNRFNDGEAHAAWGGASINPGPIVTVSKSTILDADGTSTTILMSESVEEFRAGGWNHTVAAPGPRYGDAEPFLGMVWWAAPAAGTPVAAKPNPLWTINGKGTPEPGYPVRIQYARPSSNHQGGVNVLFCDQHARFVSDSIDYMVYAALMTPDGSRCQPPVGSVNPVENYPPYRSVQIDEEDLW